MFNKEECNNWVNTKMTKHIDQSNPLDHVTSIINMETT